MRVMGHKPMPIAEFDEYLATLRPLLRGEQADFAWRGRTAPIRHLMPDDGFVNFADEIPMYVSGFGPRSLALAGRHGDGAVLSVPPDPAAMARVWASIEAGAEEAGRDLDRDSYLTCSLTTMVVLEPGEDRHSERVRRLCGAFAMASLHYLYDQWRQYGRPPSGRLDSVWAEYSAQLDQVPDELRHLRIHAGHNCWVLPEEERFLSPELLEGSCMIGTAAELVDRLGALGEAGLDQVMILPPFDPRYEVLEQVAAEVAPALA
jgi:alkanesulfonate monooxygenase SsuD/methylene tetrahydromethanopterin reductase-like flavin-dependent oxidoreductase (luciferase family)